MDIATLSMGAAGSLVVATVAHGIDHVRKWPFVALSSFQERSATVEKLSGMLRVEINPVVTDADREAWENYTVNHFDNEWYMNGREYQKVLGFDGLDDRPKIETDELDLDLSGGIANHIFDINELTGMGEIAPRASWYLPVWEVGYTLEDV